LSSRWTLTTRSWVNVYGFVWWVVKNTIWSFCTTFGWILILSINLSLLCYIQVWCTHRFVSYRLHLLFILLLCRFWNKLMCDLF
jgi:hypothetical protein